MPNLPKLQTLVCLDDDASTGIHLDDWLDGLPADPWQAEAADDTVLIAGTGGTTGKPTPPRSARHRG